MDTINKEQRNAVNRLTKYILRNIIWILGFIWKYTKILYLKPIISIPVHLISTFISLNLTRWIFDTVENQGSFSCIIILLVAVSLFRILCNLFFAVFNFLIGDRKKLNSVPVSGRISFGRSSGLTTSGFRTTNFLTPIL